MGSAAANGRDANTAVVAGERAAEQGIVAQVDLADREIVGCAPIGVHDFELVLV